jgi:hypothetical protein
MTAGKRIIAKSIAYMICALFTCWIINGIIISPLQQKPISLRFVHSSDNFTGFHIHQDGAIKVKHEIPNYQTINIRNKNY